ncbi:hypothetical protein Poli38472_006256 [Pythium oligandrum]|uniref:histidinol-phosphate transaminase n=1 Tax=Pythium oligandrum TaxID=41045 RepID=A0A8K1FSQ7_PYTOL|nr:hypothetical protein Poli38472_006256 [Pythium oligandrum]|eukprot:TMW68788.1 hypothetical protein Poli38472_006256 [Pythium oligandrum]
MLDKNGVLALSVTAGIGVGYLLGQRQQVAAKKPAGKCVAKNESQDEIERLIRPNILELTPYRCARDDYDQGILLDANENSLGPPLEPHHQLRQEQLERYPCPYQKDLKQKLANYRNAASSEYKIGTENIFLGVGSDEAIDLIIRVACTPRVDSILITPPTYGMYQVCANIHDVNIIAVPLEVQAPASNPKGLIDSQPLPAFHINPQKILAAVTPETKIIFLCSPGNPTANSVRVIDILTILESPRYKGLVVVDEAYIDFSDSQSLCTLVKKYKRLVVLQTLSKAFGLAGIRLGSAFGDPKLIQILNNVKAPYNINKLTAKVAHEALDSIAQVQSKIDLIKKEKERVIKALRQLSFVKAIYASDSNFVLFEVPNALKVYREMADRGVVIRFRGNQLLLNDCLRATIGSRDENDKMLELLERVSAELA